MARLPLLASWRRDFIMCAHATAIGPCEDTANWSVLVKWFLRKVGLTSPAFWCMASVATDAERAFGARSPLLMTGSCEEQRQRAIKLGAHRTREQFEEARAADPMSVAGWVGLCIGPDEAGKPHAHHTWLVGAMDDARDIIVTGPRGGVLTIEGNAADPKKPSSRNGDGKYEGRERCHADDKGTYEFIDPAGYPL